MSIKVELERKAEGREDTQMYKDMVDRAESSGELVRLGRTIMEKLNDEKWAREVFDLAKKACNSVVGCTIAAHSLHTSLGDTERARSVYAKAVSLCDRANDYESVARSAIANGYTDVAILSFQTAEKELANAKELKYLAENVLLYLNDREWSTRIYQNALKAPEANRWRRDIILSIQSRLDDRGWRSKLY